MYIVHNLRIMSAKQQPMTAKQCSLIHVACNVVKKKKNDIRINSGYVVKTTHFNEIYEEFGFGLSAPGQHSTTNPTT
jgi:hypothetical protein